MNVELECIPVEDTDGKLRQAAQLLARLILDQFVKNEEKDSRISESWSQMAAMNIDTLDREIIAPEETKVNN